MTNSVSGVKKWGGRILVLVTFLSLPLLSEVRCAEYPDQKAAAMLQPPDSPEILPVVKEENVFELPGEEFNYEADPAEWTKPTLSTGESIPSVPTDNPLPDTPLYRLADKIVSSVVILRAYDEYGMEVARTAGFFVTQDGKVMTDGSLLSKRGLGKTSYVTLATASGSLFAVSGFCLFDKKSGILVLQSDASNVIPLQGSNGETSGDDDKLSVAMVGVSDEKGLLLVDGSLLPAEGLADNFWMPINGKNSPGTPGSPVLNMKGQLLGMVGTHLKLKNWINYALEVEATLAEVENKNLPAIPFSRGVFQSLPDITNEEQFIAGFRSLYENSPASATRTFNGLINKYPRSPELWSLLGLSLSASKKSDLALAAFRRAAALDPEKGLPWYGLAVANVKSGRSGLSETTTEALEKYLSSETENGEAWKILAAQYLRSQQPQQALEALRQAANRVGEDWECYYLAARAEAQMQDLEKASVSLEKSLTLNTKNVEGWFFSGLLKMKKADVNGAIEAYRKVVVLNPNHPRAWMNLSQAYLKKGDRTEARITFDRHRKLPVVSTPEEPAER